MTLEEIYMHFQVPMDKSDAIFSATYTKDTAKRVRKQQKELNKRLVHILRCLLINETIL